MKPTHPILFLCGFVFFGFILSHCTRRANTRPSHTYSENELGKDTTPTKLIVETEKNPKLQASVKIFLEKNYQLEFDLFINFLESLAEDKLSSNEKALLLKQYPDWQITMELP